MEYLMDLAVLNSLAFSRILKTSCHAEAWNKDNQGKRILRKPSSYFWIRFGPKFINLAEIGFSP